MVRLAVVKRCTETQVSGWVTTRHRREESQHKNVVLFLKANCNSPTKMRMAIVIDAYGKKTALYRKNLRDFNEKKKLEARSHQFFHLVIVGQFQPSKLRTTDQ